VEAVTDHVWPKSFHWHAEPHLDHPNGSHYTSQYCCMVRMEYDEDDSEDSEEGKQKVSQMGAAIFFDTLAMMGLELPPWVHSGRAESN
jgi:hypothetical protein